MLLAIRKFSATGESEQNLGSGIGIADMTGLATGSTRSRMSRIGHGTFTAKFSKIGYRTLAI